MMLIHVVLDSPKTANNLWGRTKGLSLQAECSNYGLIVWCWLWVPAINHSRGLKLLHRFISLVLLIQGLTVNGEYLGIFFSSGRSITIWENHGLRTRLGNRNLKSNPHPKSQKDFLMRFHYYLLNVCFIYVTHATYYVCVCLLTHMQVCTWIH